MKQINPNIYPKGGYWFQDSDGSRHIGQTWKQVAGRVEAYRRRRGAPIGNPLQEVYNQVCAREPSLCFEETRQYQERLQHASLKTRVLRWLQAMRERKKREPFRYVPLDLQRARTDVCLHCPHHTGLPRGCGSCMAAIKEFRKEFIGDRPVDDRYQACVLLGEYMPVASWVDTDAVDFSPLPRHCWRKRTI